jgi:hypothetical protein
MEQSPSWEANSVSAILGIPRLLWNLRFHYRVYNSPLLVPVICQMHPVHKLPPYFANIHATPRSSESLPSGFPTTILYAFATPHACYMSRPYHPPGPDHPNKIWWSLQVMKLLIMQCSPASRHLHPLRSKYSPRTLFSNTLSLCSFLCVRDQVSHPH